MLVLFVDDDHEDYELFCEAIAQIHPEVKCLHAKNGQQALFLLRELTVLPNYIFLDVNMPIMTGKETLNILKADPILKEIPVISYSTTTNDKEIAIFKYLGASHFLVKPSDFTVLVNALRELIK